MLVCYIIWTQSISIRPVKLFLNLSLDLGMFSKSPRKMCFACNLNWFIIDTSQTKHTYDTPVIALPYIKSDMLNWDVLSGSYEPGNSSNFTDSWRVHINVVLSFCCSYWLRLLCNRWQINLQNRNVTAKKTASIQANNIYTSKLEITTCCTG